MQLAERLSEVRRVRLPWQPWSVLVPLGLLQWLGAVVFALRARHTGWFFHNDAHSTWTWTGGWLLGRAHLPGVVAGWGWSFLLMPISWIAGADYVTGLRILIVLQGLILLPLGVGLAYAAGARLGGRSGSYVAAGLWALGPFLVVLQLLDSGKQIVENELVAPVLGLTGSVALPSALTLLCAGWLVLRALDGEQIRNGAAAGMAAGLAIAIEPLNGLFLVAAALGLAIGRRPQAAVAFGAGLAPFLAVLALWRLRGPDGLDLAGVTGAFHFSAARLSYTFTWVREYFWSLRLFQWIAAAGFVALVRVAPAKAVFLGSWLLAFVVFRGSDPAVDAHAGTFWPAVAGGLPAFCLLTASLPLLVPGRPPSTDRSTRPVPAAALVGACAALVLAPLGLIAAASHARGNAVLADDGAYVPSARDLGLRAVVSDGAVALSWRTVPGLTVSYSPYRGAAKVANTYGRGLVDKPGRGTWSYRLARQASEVPSGGGITVELSRPVAVHVP